MIQFREIWLYSCKFGFDCDTCGVLVSIDEQSADIAMGVDEALESKDGNGEVLDKIGAGDQGMMFGYASNETPDSCLCQFPWHIVYLVDLQKFVRMGP